MTPQIINAATVQPIHFAVEGPAGDGRAPVTVARVLDALERKYPVLEGTIRDHATRQRRPFLRFFA